MQRFSMTFCAATLLATGIFGFATAEEPKSAAKPKAPAPRQAPAPRPFSNGHSAVVAGQNITLIREGQLIVHNAMWATERKYNTLAGKLGPFLDVANDKAYVMTSDEVCEISLSSGKVLRSAKHTIGHGAVGVINPQRVFVQNGLRMQIIDLESGRKLHDVKLSDADRASRSLSHARHLDQVFVATADGIAKVDLNSGKMSTPWKHLYGTTSLRVSGNKLFVAEFSISYGFGHETLRSVDLSNQELAAIPLPRRPRSKEDLRVSFRDKSYAPITLARGNKGIALACRDAVCLLDANGKIIRKGRALKTGESLVAAINHAALVQSKSGLATIHLKPLATTTAATESSKK